MAFGGTEPFGEAREDLRMAILASVLVNVNRGKNQKVFTPQDFMPDFWGQSVGQAEIQAETSTERNERLLPKIRNLRAIFGGKK